MSYAPGLDGVRAIAVCGVLLYHARVRWLPGGFLGVDVFFVLSGYLITSLLLVEQRRHGAISLTRFWLGRARRLLPAATAVIAVCLLVGAIWLPGQFRTLRGDALASLLYFNNWHQVLASHSYFAAFGRPPLLQHYWSLAVEEQFYLVWPLVLALTLNRWRRRSIVLLALSAAAGSAVVMGLLYHPGLDPSRVYYGTDTRAVALMTGALLAFAWPFGRMTGPAPRGARVALDGLGLAGLAVLAWAMLGWHDYDAWLYRGGFAIVAGGAALVVAAAAHPASHVAGALGVRPLRWIGQRSYGIYLWHWPVMALSRPGIDLHWTPWLLVPAQIAATLGLAALSYRYIEMPVRRGEPQRRLRTWADQRRPHQRLAALAGSTGLIAAAVTLVAVVPSGAARPAHRLVSAAAAARTVTGEPVAARHVSAPASAPAKPRGAVLAVGASVMLAAEPQLERRLRARVDAAVGRQASAIISRLEQYRQAGELPRRVVVQIGDNGPLWYSDVVRLRKVLAGVPQVVLVNVREPTSWQDEVNGELVQAVQGWPQATIADWWSASTNADLLYDGAHPTDAGAVVYARVVAHSLKHGAASVPAHP